MKEFTNAEIETLQVAKEATYLESKLKPFFEEIEKGMLLKLKGNYRLGQMDAKDLEVSIATLCAMDDLRNQLMQKIKKAKPIEEGTFHDRENNVQWPPGFHPDAYD